MYQTSYRLPKKEEKKNEQRKMRRAKKKALKKYGKVCSKCGEKNNLQVHHTFSRAYYPRKKYRTKWLRVLCKDCHTQLHVSKGGFHIKTTFTDYKYFIMLNDKAFKKWCDIKRVLSS